MRTISTCIACAATALVVAACGGDQQLAAELNQEPGDRPANEDGTSSTLPGQEPAQGQRPEPGEQGAEEQSPVQGQQPAPASGEVPAGGDESVDLGLPLEDPAPGEESSGGGDTPATENGGETDGESAAEPEPPGPYAPRSGSFRMLVYSRTTGFRHDSIAQGKAMLQDIASEQGFEVVETETNELITAEGLAQFEIVFFMNSTGDIFNQNEENAFQEWMETKNGAFAGVHSATDTEQGWAFYKEVTGQYYDGHTNANTPGAVQFESAMVDFPALRGLPNPWQRNEEWYRFNSFQQWTGLPGLQVLGRKQADNQPIMWIREWDNWRSFYTALGHDAAAFRDPAVKQHVTGGILWAVRRDHLLQ